VKIWFTEIGEPLPFEKDVRLHRYGILTQHLARLGHDVTWWTSTFSHANKQFVFDRDHDETVNGVHIRAIHGPGYRRNVSFERIRHQADFARKFVERAKKETELPDIIVTPVPTLETASLTIQFAKERGIPVVTDIRDEWPEEFVDLAPKPVRPLARVMLSGAFRKIEYICSNVDGIIGISQRQLEYGLRYSGRSRGPQDAVLPLGYPNTTPDAAKVATAKAYWLEQGVRPDAFVACFFGTIGKFFDLGTVIEAARILEKEFDVQFVLCGSGTSLDAFKKQAKGLKSVLFPGWVDAPKIAALMQLSKAGLAPYVKGARMALPNKPFEYMAGRLPVVSSLEQEVKELLARENCGLSYDADSVDELCAAVRLLAGEPKRTEEMSKNARRLFEREFTLEKTALNWSEYLDRVADMRSRPEPAPT
jgi:glycosyltransferase involved in cell wall biosynthesis